MRRGPRLYPSAFTLVELLVVTAIVTTLIAMLLPALGRARAQARQVHCAANLRMVGIGLLAYVLDHRHYPASEYEGPIDASRRVAAWLPRLRRAIGGNTAPFHCPARPADWAWETTFGPAGSVSGAGGAEQRVYADDHEVALGYERGERLFADIPGFLIRFSYGYNGDHARVLGRRVLTPAFPTNHTYDDNRHERRAPKVRVPSETIAIGDSNESWRLSPSAVADVHRGGANVLFCDGRLRAEMLLLDPLTPQGQRQHRMWNYDHQP